MNKIADISTDFFGSGTNWGGQGGVSQLVSVLVKNLLMIAGVALLFIIVSSALSMVVGAGEPQRFEKAKASLTVGIVGFIIVVASWFLVRIIEVSTGVNILNP